MMKNSTSYSIGLIFCEYSRGNHQFFDLICAALAIAIVMLSELDC